jgi:hypothetical protein
MREVAAITFGPDGTGRCLHHDAIRLQSLGRLACRRASRVEFNARRQAWEVTSAATAAVVYRSPSRQRCLDWERRHLSPA